MSTTDPIGLRLPTATHRARRATPRHRADRRTAATLLKEAPHVLRAALHYLTAGSAAKDADQ